MTLSLVEAPAADQTRRRWATRLVGPWLAWAAVLAIAVISIHKGLELRRWAWDQTLNIRFTNSVNNTIDWGRFTNEVGRGQVYEMLVKRFGDEGDYTGGGRMALDYPPLRLLVAARWAAWAKRTFPPRPGQPIVWQPQYAFTEPMLRLNTACELAAALAMFLLVRHWVRRCDVAPRPRRWWWRRRKTQGQGEAENPIIKAGDELKTPTRHFLVRALDLLRHPGLALRASGPALLAYGWALSHRALWASGRGISHLALNPPSTRGLFAGVLAALLLWFNPALIWNAHVFPQWDAWILPAYLFAVYFALRNWWLAAGMVIGVAGMAKGQIFLVGPLLLLWPIFRLRFGAALRMVVGVVVGVVAVASPWLLRDERAVWWVIRVTAAIAVLLPVMWGRSSTRKALLIQAGCIVVAAGLVLWPWLLRSRPGALTIPLRAGWFPAAWAKEGLRFTERSLVLLLTGGLVVGAKLLPRRATFAWACAGVAAAMCLCVPLFNGSMAWYTVGLAYGTRHWRTLYWCNASNLGAILQLRYGWRWGDYINLADYLPFIHRPWIVPMRYTMVAGYAATLALCAWGLARKVRWHDRRMLFAIAAPWVLMFALLPQMLDRYLIWAAAFSAAAAAVSRGGFVLHVSITAINVIEMAFYMLGSCRACPEKVKWLPRLAPLHPDIGWAVLALAGVWLYLAVTAGRRPAVAACDHDGGRTGLRQSLAP